MRRLFHRRDTKAAIERDTSLSVARDVTAHVTEGGIVLLHERKGLLFTANNVGAKIWLGISRKQSAEQIARDLHETYQTPVPEITDDIRSFTAELRDRGLLQ